MLILLHPIIPTTSRWVVMKVVLYTRHYARSVLHDPDPIAIQLGPFQVSTLVVYSPRTLFRRNQNEELRSLLMNTSMNLAHSLIKKNIFRCDWAPLLYSLAWAWEVFNVPALKPQIYGLTKVKEMPGGWSWLLNGGATYMIFNPDTMSCVSLNITHLYLVKPHEKVFLLHLCSVASKTQSFNVESASPALTDWFNKPLSEMEFNKHTCFL